MVPEEQHCQIFWSSISDWHLSRILGELALFALDLLCFHYAFSIMLAVTNIWRERSFSLLIQTWVQSSWVFTKWSFSNKVTLNWNKCGTDGFSEVVYCFLLSGWNWNWPMASSTENLVFNSCYTLFFLESVFSERYIYTLNTTFSLFSILK